MNTKYHLSENLQNTNELSKKQDRELVESLIGGSQEAFGEVYVRYREWLICLCKQYMRNETDAEDMVHDVFLKVWESRHSLKPELSLSGYVKTIAHNLIFNKIRNFEVHSRFVKNKLMNEIDSNNETEDLIIDNDYSELLDKLIESLSPKQKEVFLLSRKEGYTYKEIADMLNISVETVREHASLALKKIQKQLTQHTDIHFKKIITILMFFL